MTACPTPQKRAYDDSKAAWAHAGGLRRSGASIDVKAYRCQCGKWHVGHSVGSLLFRIRQARRRGTA